MSARVFIAGVAAFVIAAAAGAQERGTIEFGGKLAHRRFPP